MKVGEAYEQKYYVMVDKDNDLVQIDWMDGGTIHKSTQCDAVTAWPDTDSTRSIVLANMRNIINLNLGLGLRIAVMLTKFYYKELVDVECNTHFINQTGQAS